MPSIPEMTDEERLARIGVLLRKAAVRYWAAIDAGEIPPPPEMAVSEPHAEVPLSDSDRILRYIERCGAASPKDIRLALGFSRATAQRRLADLAREGHIVGQGKTHSLLYLLNSRPNGLS